MTDEPARDEQGRTVAGTGPPAGAETGRPAGALALRPSVGASVPGGVRVSLGPASAHAGLEPLVVDGADPDAPQELNGLSTDVTFRRVGPGRAALSVGGATVEVLLGAEPGPRARTGRVRREVLLGGWRVVVDMESAARAALRARARRSEAGGASSGPTDVRAMIPGVVLAVAVVVGDRVSAGQKLVVIEAMKMQNELLAPRDGVIDRVTAVPGARIEVGDLLLVMS